MANNILSLDLADNLGHGEPTYLGDHIGSTGPENDSLFCSGEGVDNNDEFAIDGDASISEYATNLEGHRDLLSGDENARDDENLQGLATKRTCPAFFDCSTRAAERSARRTKFDGSQSFIIQEGDDLFTSTPSRVPGTFGRRNRDKGSTLPAYHKKVSHELDSDDELMMEMREKGYSDRQIADRLAKDGRVRYDQKSISTRISRIKDAQAKQVDYLLQEGYMEWRLEDDQLLMQAYDLADIEIRYEMERLRAWRFKRVADCMRRLNKDAKFSQEACYRRYTAFINGTAVIPTDQDDNPKARRLEMEIYHTKREAERIAEEIVKNSEDAEARRIKDEASLRIAQKAADTAARRDVIQQEKAIRAIHRAAQAQIRAQRSAEHKKRQVERNTILQAKRAAEKAELERKKRKAARSKLLSLNHLRDVTTDASDPRGTLSLADLTKLCGDRGLSTAATAKDNLVQRLRDADEALSAKDLKQMIKSKGIGLGGTKIQMRYQLAFATAMDCDSYQFDGEDAADSTHVNLDQEMVDTNECGGISSDNGLHPK